MGGVGRYVLGVDSGTQGVRAGLYSLDGECVSSGEREYGIAFPRPGWAEQDAREVWKALVAAVADCVRNSGVHPRDIVAMCCDGTSSTVLAVDANGEPLMPAILWMDCRAVSQAERISSTRHPVLRYVGGRDSVEWMTPKALWLLENEPEVYEQAHRVLETTDWFVFQLTGEWTASLCNTTCKWNYASPDGGWSVEFLDAVGLSGVLEKWPSRVLPMGAEAGRLLPEPANELGLVPGIPVAEGGIDAHVGMVGLGVTEPGSAAVILGSSVVHLALSESPVFDPGIWGPYPDAVIPGLWLVEGGQVSAGSILAWFKDNFAADIIAEARTAAVSPYSLLDRLAESTPPGAEGLIVLDHFQGNRTPLRDPFSRGAVWGLTLSHSKGHLVRAVYESLAFGTRHIFDTWSRAGFSVDHVCVSGGGTRSRVWLQTLAAVCKSPIHVPRDSQAGCLGCAICAAVAAGEYGSITEAAREMVHVASTVEPDPAAFEDYDFYYDKYLRTYEALRALMHEVANKQMSGRTE